VPWTARGAQLKGCGVLIYNSTLKWQHRLTCKKTLLHLHHFKRAAAAAGGGIIITSSTETAAAAAAGVVPLDAVCRDKM